MSFGTNSIGIPSGPLIGIHGVAEFTSIIMVHKERIMFYTWFYTVMITIITSNMTD